MSYPILYEAGTRTIPNHFGIGVLGDCIECQVTKELGSGYFELRIQYPTEGVHALDIKLESVIAAEYQVGNWQLFKVYSLSQPINKQFTVQAEHVSYGLADIPVKPYSCVGLQNVLSGITTNAVLPVPYTITTDIVDLSWSFNTFEPCTIRDIMSDSDGMIGAKYPDAEWEYNNYSITLKSAGVGSDKSNYIVYTYGKNVADFTQDSNLTNTVTGIFPYYHTTTDDNRPIAILGSICYGEGHERFNSDKIEIVDVESYFTEEEKEAWGENEDGVKLPTQAQVNSKAQMALDDIEYVCRPEINISIKPVDLAKVEGYESVAAALEQVNLGDTIGIDFPDYDLFTTAKITKIEFDSIHETVTSMEVGDPKKTVAEQITSIGEAVEANRAGIIVSKDSILLYVNKQDGSLGSKIEMTETNIKSTVAGSSTSWNMVPITGGSDVGGLGLAITFYGYGNPEDTYPAATCWEGDTFFDDETGYLYIVQGGQWQHYIDPNTGGWLQADSMEVKMTSYIDQTADSITQHVEATDGRVAELRVDLNGVSSTVSSNYNTLSSQITQTSTEIRTQVSDLETNTNSSIRQLSNSIDMKVDSNGVISAINMSPESIQISSSKVNITGYVTFSDLSTSGRTTINGNNITTGKINANYIDASGIAVTKLYDDIGDIVYDGEYRAFRRDVNFSSGTYVTLNGQTEIANCVDITFNCRPSFSSSAAPHWGGGGGATILGLSDQNNLIHFTQSDISGLSSMRYKHDIAPATDDSLDPHKLYNLQVSQFRYNSGLEYHDDHINDLCIGLIAEDVNEIYPIACKYDDYNRPDNWNPRYIIPPMIALIQEQHTKIENLEQTVKQLQDEIAALKKGE